MYFRLSDIPPLFRSSETGDFIQHCLVCERKLLDGAEYMIEKAFVNYPGMNTQDLIWEYAICLDCINEMKSEYSEESNRKIAEYFQSHMNFSLQEKLDSEDNLDADDWTSKCIVSGKKKELCSQYQVYAYCIGDKCTFENAPFMIADDAIDEVVKLISDKTLGFMNDFRDKYFPPPADLSPFFKDRDFVLI